MPSEAVDPDETPTEQDDVAEVELNDDEPGDDDTVDDDTVDDDAVDEESEWLQQHRLELAQQRASAVAAGRRKAGTAGAIMAGAMFALRDALEGPPKDDMRVEAESPSDPIDLDNDGFEMTVDGVDVEAPPLERLDPARHDRKKSHR